MKTRPATVLAAMSAVIQLPSATEPKPVVEPEQPARLFPMSVRFDYMVDELDTVQKTNGDGYVGGVPDSKELCKGIREGNVDLMRTKWVPWYNSTRCMPVSATPSCWSATKKPGESSFASATGASK